MALERGARPERDQWNTVLTAAIDDHDDIGRGARPDDEVRRRRRMIGLSAGVEVTNCSCCRHALGAQRGRQLGGNSPNPRRVGHRPATYPGSKVERAGAAGRPRRMPVEIRADDDRADFVTRVEVPRNRDTPIRERAWRSRRGGAAPRLLGSTDLAGRGARCRRRQDRGGRPLVGGFTALCLDRAGEEAKAAEAAWARRHARGRSRASPSERRTCSTRKACAPRTGRRCSSRTCRSATRRPFGAPARAGAILVGKTQTHEFAWGITSVNERMGTARNPWALDRVSGGSSGGSAVVLAADELPLTLGSDTGGSIRVPASFCGVVGLKPTFGRISAARAWPLARSLDHPGPMARTPADAALLLEVLAGVDPDDPATEDVAARRRSRRASPRARGLVVGLCPDLHLVSLAPDVRAVLDAAVASSRTQGRRSSRSRFPRRRSCIPAFGVIQRAEALDTHRRAGLFPGSPSRIRAGRARAARGAHRR